MIVGMLAMMELCVRVKRKNLYHISSIGPINENGRQRRRATSLMGKLTNQESQKQDDGKSNESMPIYSVLYSSASSYITGDSNLRQPESTSANESDDLSLSYQNRGISHSMSTDTLPSNYLMSDAYEATILPASLCDEAEGLHESLSNGDLNSTRLEGTNSS